MRNKLLVVIIMLVLSVVSVSAVEAPDGLRFSGVSSDMRPVFEPANGAVINSADLPSRYIIDATGSSVTLVSKIEGE